MITKTKILLFVSRCTVKLHCSKLAYRILRPFIRVPRLPISSYNKVDVHNYLNSLSEDPNHSCVRDQPVVNAHQYDLQIIVPVYKVEDYIEECMDSILSQKTQYNFQVIVINDGSPDRSRDILRKYEPNPRVLIIDQENRGFSGARNTGLNFLNARYIMFVDSDDRLADHAIENLMSRADKLNADVVEGGFVRFYNNGIQFSTSWEYDEQSPSFSGYACMKIIRGDFFQKIQFPLCYWFEDTIMSMIVASMADRIVRISECVYYYRMNYGGITKLSKGRLKNLDTLWINRRLLADRVSLNLPNDEQFYELELEEIRNVHFIRIASIGSDAINQMVFLEFSHYIRSYFPNFKLYHVKNELKQIHQAFLDKDYRMYLLACLFHV